MLCYNKNSLFYSMLHIQKLRWQQILVHFTALIFIVHAFHMFSYLSGIKIIDSYFGNRNSCLKNLINSGLVSVEYLTDFSIWESLSISIGYLFAFIVSLGISIRKKWFWLNSLVVLLLAFFLFRYFDLGWPVLQTVVLYFRSKTDKSIFLFSSFGSVLMAIGLVIFFAKPMIRFIENNKKYQYGTG